MANRLTEAMNVLFGWDIRRAIPDTASILPAIVPEVRDDGAIVVAAGGSYGTYIDLDGALRTDSEMVTRYREMSIVPEIDNAIQDICNEAIIIDDVNPIIRMNLDDIKEFNDVVKDAMEVEFQKIQKLLEFNEHAYDLFRRWYVDGRMYFQAIIDSKAPELGIQKLSYIDPRKIRKVREVKQTVSPGTNVIVGRTVSQYFMYNEKGFNGVANLASPNSASNVAGALKIAEDSVVYITSGLTDSARSNVLGWLHKAIKPMNQLREMEDSTIIYRISRAPTRRIFNIEVGDMPKAKAEQYVNRLMEKNKNRLEYDASSGQITDARKFTTMLEDFWFPKRNGTVGTTVENLDPGPNALGDMDQVDYFKQKLYESLNVPISRLNADQPFAFDPSQVISRDEIKFSRFITRLRQRFNHLFLALLRRQLVLKGVMSETDWDLIKEKIKFEYARDNYFEELKDISIQKARMDLLTLCTPYVGLYFSHTNIRKNILKQNDDDIKENSREIIAEMQDPLYAKAYFPAPEDTTPGP